MATYTTQNSDNAMSLAALGDAEIAMCRMSSLARTKVLTLCFWHEILVSILLLIGIPVVYLALIQSTLLSRQATSAAKRIPKACLGPCGLIGSFFHSFINVSVYMSYASSVNMLFLLILAYIAVPVWAGIFQSLNPFTGSGLDITHVIVTTITVFTDQPDLLLKQEEEKANLHHRLQRSAGKWDSSHPRHRLLSALYGYSRYRERNTENVNRWRDFYKRIPRKQRSVCYTIPISIDEC